MSIFLWRNISSVRNSLPAALATVVNSDSEKLAGTAQYTSIDFTDTDGFALISIVNIAGADNAPLTRLYSAALHAASGALSTPSLGALGFETAADDDYDPSGFPSSLLTTFVSQAPISLRGQGWTSQGLLVNRTSPTEVVITPTIHGVPLFDQTVSLSPTAIDAIIGGGYGSSLGTLTSGRMIAPDKWDRVELHAPLTEAEAGRIARNRISALGAPQKKVAWIWLGDSLHAFQQNALWKLYKLEILRPGYFAYNAARGGSFFGGVDLPTPISTDDNCYDAADRAALFLRQVTAACAEFDEVNIQFSTLTNDIGGAGRAMSETTPYGTWQAGRQAIIDFYFDLVANVPNGSKIRWNATTCPWRYRWCAPDRNATEDARRAILIANNESWRTDYAALGFDDLMDLNAFVPTGFTTQEEACIYAAENGDDSFYLPTSSPLDALHFSDAGGQQLAEGLYRDKILARLIAVGAVVEDVTPPVITSSAAVSVQENTQLAHALTATDANLLTWSIVGGADAAQFELSGTTLRFASDGTQDFESPADANTDNDYVVTVRATDLWGNTSDQTITVTVTDVTETVGPPVVETRAKHAGPTSNLTTYVPTLPAGVQAGDLIVVGISADGAGTLTASAGWTKLGQAGVTSLQQTAIFYRVADGGGDDALTISNTVAEQYSSMSWRISNAAGLVSGTGSASPTGGTADADLSAHDAGSSADRLWLWFVGYDVTTVPSAGPTGWSNFDSQIGGGAGASSAGAELTSSDQSVDPGPATNASDQWAGFVVAIS